MLPLVFRLLIGLLVAGFKAVLEAEDLPAATSRDKYIKNVAKELVVDSVKWQMEALRAGFRCITAPTILSIRTICTPYAPPIRTIQERERGGKIGFKIRHRMSICLQSNS